MNVEFLGFSITPTTQRARWIVYGSCVLFALAMLAMMPQRNRELRRNVERIAGFDMPADLKPRWDTGARTGHSINLDLGQPRFRSLGFRLSEDMARALMRTCGQRGGLLLERDDARRQFPEFASRIGWNSPVCIRSEQKPRRALSLLDDTTLSILIQYD